MKYSEEITTMLILIFGSVRNGVIKAMLSPGGFWVDVRTFLLEHASDAPAFFCKDVAAFVRAWMDEDNVGKCFLKCDDWCIYAKDKEGRVYSVCTELWDRWLDLHEGADQEEDAVEKYMLPIARERWTSLSWSLCPDLELEERKGWSLHV